MPSKDELAQRRYEHLVEHLAGLLRASLKPEYEGYYGQLILSAERLEELGALDDIRRAAREAGRILGWKTTTKLVRGRLFVLDEREVPQEIYLRASDTATARSTQPQSKLGHVETAAAPRPDDGSHQRPHRR
ncbi:hypothetical protein ACFRAO_39575 [Streptomyces sp. NPDC056656]|uniref:hypothetical protein n=1 Tax=Streptomyces sp. NPDC056656 TaxID=3345895 RepID=UPI0036789AE8